MIRAKFQEVANQLDCKYEYSEKGHVSIISRDIPVSFHKLTILYKSVTINLVYEFGGQNLGKVETIIDTNKKIHNFSVQTKSQIQRLFSKEKHVFKVEAKDHIFESEIKEILYSSKYNDIVIKTTFEPEIAGLKQEGQYTISTGFYLGFEDKELSIIPSIDLHKRIIDVVIKRCS